MHVVSDEKLAPPTMVPVEVKVVVEVKVGGDIGKVEIDTELVEPEFVDEGENPDDEFNIGDEFNVVDAVLRPIELVNVDVTAEVNVVLTKWAELLVIELNEIVAVPFVFDVDVNGRIEDSSPDVPVLVLDEVQEVFEEAETWPSDVGAVVMEADAVSERVPDDPRFDDVVCVLEAVSCDDESTPPLVTLANEDAAVETEAPELEVPDTGKSSELVADAVSCGVDEVGGPNDD